MVSADTGRPGSIVQRIRELERVSRALEPDADGRARMRDPFLAYTERFLDEIHERKAYGIDKTPVRRLSAVSFSDDPADPESLVGLLEDCIDPAGLNPASGGHLAYIPGGGVYPAALGDYIAAVTNHYAGITQAGPGAVEMENRLIRWMADLVGYPPEAGGYLASGGSVANLIAVVTARETKRIRAADVRRAVVYATDQVHHSVDKALHIAGLGECVRRRVPMDERYRMDAAALAAAVAEDRQQRRLPWLVVASAGTTDTGAVDPLAEIGEIAGEYGLWYHVDAAYGGFFLLCPESRPGLEAMARAESIVLDPHKGLFLPYGLGAVLVRDDAALMRAHAQRAAYLQDAHDPEGASPSDRSPELTKHWRGPRMWLPLMLYGIRPFRACLEEKLLLARYFRDRASELGFEVGPGPDLSVVLHRWVPATGDANAFNRQLLRKIHEDGRVFVSSTSLNGTFVLRLAVLSFRTHLDTIDRYLGILADNVRELAGLRDSEP